MTYVDVRVGVGSRPVANEHGVALGEVAGTLGIGLDLQVGRRMGAIGCAHGRGRAREPQAGTCLGMQTRVRAY